MATLWYSTANNSAIYVRVGAAGAIETCPDPFAYNAAWTAQTSPVQTDLRAVAWNGFAFVAVGLGGVSVYSQDGLTWTHFNTGTLNDLYALATAANVYIAVGAAGTIVVSQNGQVWSAIASGVTATLRSVTVAGSVYTAVGDNNTIVSGPITSTLDNVVFAPRFVVRDVWDVSGSIYNPTQAETSTLGDLQSYTGNTYYNAVQELTAMTTGLSQPFWTYVPALLENMLFSGNVVDALIAFVENVLISEKWQVDYERIISETTALATVVLSLLDAFPALSETTALNEAPASNTLTLLAFTDVVKVTGAYSDNAALQARISEQFLAGLSFVYEGETYDGWVLNTDTMGLTRYTNFNFTSMAATDEGTFATDGANIYQLGGSTDNGAAIAASLLSGTMDFGTAYKKNLRRAYLGVRADGSLLLKLTTDQNTERWYELTQTSSGLHDAKIRLQRGVKARYWTYELTNVAGSDFELESIEFLPMVISRKVRR